MTASPDPSTLNELLQHEAWLRGLARVLVGPSDAEDLVQDTWMAAAKSPPSGAARPWLGAVARRLAAQTRRSRGRAARREALAARPEALPSTEETLQALAVQRAVTKAVDELEEPFRTAVLLRYHHELGYPEVAGRMSCTEATARQRVARGLARIRGRLADRHGSDWRAMPGFAVLCGLPDPIHGTAGVASTGTAVAPHATLLVGGLVMFKLFAGLSAVAVCLYLGWLSFSGLDGPVQPDADPTPTAAAESGEDGAAGSAGVSRRDAETAVGPATVSDQSVLATEQSLQVVDGRVVDARGEPLSGVPIMRRLKNGLDDAAEQVAVSGPSGAFTVELERSHARLSAGEPWCPLTYYPLSAPETSATVVLVAEKPAVVTGFVFAASAGGTETPLEGAIVEPSAEKLLSLPLATDRAVRTNWPGLSTEADGGFAFAELPSTGFHLSVRAEGFEPTVVDLGGSPRELRVVLQPIQTEWIEFAGTVRLPDGRFAAHGTVGLCGGRTTEVDEGGRFRLQLRREGLEAPRLFAASPGFQPVFVADALQQASPEADGSLLLDLELPAASLVIQGTVLDALGQPRAGVVVYPWMAEALNYTEIVEDYAQPVGHERNRITNMRTFAVTGSDGAFVLKGLRDRSYDLRFLDRETYTNTVRKAVMAGTQGLVVQFSAEACLDELEGRVTDPTGAPVAGATVRHMVVTWAGTDGGASASYRSSTETDEDGRFSLSSVPTSDCRIVVEHPNHVRTEKEVRGAGVFQMEVPRRCHIQLDVGASYPAAVEWRALNAAGEPLRLFKIESETRYSEGSSDLENGRSEVRQVSERAMWAELLDAAGDSVARLPIQVVPGEVTLVR